MATSVKDLLAKANAEVPSISHDEALALMADPEVLIVDVRDAHEVEASGKIKGAINVSRGMLEFRADPDLPSHDPAFRKDRPVLLYCASGGRSALSGKLLRDLGFAKVYNLGGFKAWAEAGGPVEPA